MTCPACGFALPQHARFCARCGAPQTVRLHSTDTWVLVVFGFGAVLTACVAILYSALAIYPNATTTTMDPATLRTGSVILASLLGVLCLLQTFAIAGLVRGREWGRVAATAACVIWSLTCLGVPVAVLVLTSIWRSKPASIPRRP